MSDEQRGVRRLVRRQGLEQLPRERHRERQDQPVSLRQRQRALGRLVRRALITELAVGEPGQQVRLHGGDVADNRGGAVEHRLHRDRGLPPGRLPPGRSPRRHCGSRRRRPARHRAPRAPPGHRLAARVGRGWPAVQPVTWLASACDPSSCDRSRSAALNSSSASCRRPRHACSIAVAVVQHQAHDPARGRFAGPGRCAAAIARPRRIHPAIPPCPPSSTAPARSSVRRPSRAVRPALSPPGSAAGWWRTARSWTRSRAAARQPTSR